jgi:hypothetical protein
MATDESLAPSSQPATQEELAALRRRLQGLAHEPSEGISQPEPKTGLTAGATALPHFVLTKHTLYLLSCRPNNCDTVSVHRAADANLNSLERLATEKFVSSQYSFSCQRIEEVKGNLVARAARVGASRELVQRLDLGEIDKVWRVPTTLLRKASQDVANVASLPGQVAPASGILDWEILPAGWWRAKSFDDLLSASPASPIRPWQEERLELLAGLNPTAWYRGYDLGARIYYVALFPGIVVADSGDFGNALYYYLCRDDSWKSVFRRSKREALQSGANRIIHTGNWQARVISLVDAYRSMATARR